jgi:hypothetical protein
MTKRNTYLERTRISEVRRLAASLGLTTEELLQASFRLSKDGGHLNIEGVGQLSKLRNPNVTVTA